MNENLETRRRGNDGCCGAFSTAGGIVERAEETGAVVVLLQ
jgi:hypothetical protein